MTRAELEHLIRAASTITDDDEILVIGSQAILGQFPDAPPSLLASMKVALKHGLANPSILLERLEHTDVPTDVRALVRSRISRDSKGE